MPTPATCSECPKNQGFLISLKSAKAVAIFERSLVDRWWQGNEGIDLIALNPEEKTILLGEAKWSPKPVGTNIFDDLVRKSELVKWHNNQRKAYFALFSKSGFTPAMIKVAKEKRVLLFHGEHTFNYSPTN